MNNKQKKWLIKIIIAAVLLGVAAAITHFVDLEGILGKPYSTIAEIILYLIPYVIVGFNVYKDALRTITKGQIFDENFLMIVATIGAVAVGEYPEGVMVMLLYQIGELFQNVAVNKSRQNVTALMDICPEFANIEEDGELVQVDPDDVSIGDIIVIKPGERIPLDCKVTEGTSMIDTSALTGESVPRSAKIGDELISGCINGDGMLHAEVTKEFEDSTVSKILELVENASEKKAPTEKFITKFARYYTPTVVFAALIIAIIPSIITKDVMTWIYRACTFLVVSCPCALVISVPMSFFSGIGAGSKNGILIKGSNYLEVASKLTTVVFDKTGTLTKGEFKVSQADAYNISEAELLDIAAHIEAYSNHPIASSIREAYGKSVDTNRTADVTEIAGCGLKAMVDGKEYFAGNKRILALNNIDAPEDSSKQGTYVYVTDSEKLLGRLIISDNIKDNAKSAISKLKKAGVQKTVMLTGDKKEVASSVANELGIDVMCAELLPAGKVEKVEELLNSETEKEKLAFVGDGVNDAPVLMRSDIGFAMGSMGSDAAIEAADIVIMDDNIEKIPLAIRIARKTMGIVKQNIIFALGVKLIVLVLSAFGIANMWLAVFADVGVAVLAILNAMRALSVKE